MVTHGLTLATWMLLMATYMSSCRKSKALDFCPRLYFSLCFLLGSPTGCTWVVGALYFTVATGKGVVLLGGLLGELNRLPKLKKNKNMQTQQKLFKMLPRPYVGEISDAEHGCDPVEKV